MTKVYTNSLKNAYILAHYVDVGLINVDTSLPDPYAYDKQCYRLGPDVHVWEGTCLDMSTGDEYERRYIETSGDNVWYWVRRF